MTSKFSFFGAQPAATASGTGAASSSSVAEAAVRAPELPWIEKYRPASIDDIASQSQVVQVLRSTIVSQNIPHLLFYGPPGTGKTSTILALARDIFSSDLYRSRVMELNASDERGIDVVRDKIKNFSKTVVDPHATIKVNGKVSRAPPYKIIILDEADSMTADAQAALRRTMERFSSTTRFCLICNYVSRIIGPLASRCAKFRFSAVSESECKARLSKIAHSESVIIDSEGLDTLISVSEGDLRRAIMLLQSASYIVEPGKSVSSGMIMEISGVIPPEQLASFAGLWRNSCTASSANLSRVQGIVESVVSNGYSASQLLRQLFSMIVVDTILSPRQKSKLALVIGKADMCLTNGADEQLQLMNFALECTQISAAS